MTAEEDSNYCNERACGDSPGKPRLKPNTVSLPHCLFSFSLVSILIYSKQKRKDDDTVIASARQSRSESEAVRETSPHTFGSWVVPEYEIAECFERERERSGEIRTQQRLRFTFAALALLVSAHACCR